jgi:hypothetical protein
MRLSEPMHTVCIEPLESRQLLAGVTLVTHGQDGNITGFISRIADTIVERAGGSSNASRYVMTMNRNASNQVVVQSFVREIGSPDPRTTPRGEIVIRLDWSQISSGSVSTGDVASAVAGYMSRARNGLRALSELPLHLIGHSRGASLVSALAGELGKRGIWVDQTTFLDPHPVDGIGDLFGANFGDAPMRVFDNIGFADNYWRSNGDPNTFDYNGEPVNGAHEGDLNASVQQNFFVSAHIAVAAYYVGTINTSTSNGGEHPVLSVWYGSNPSRPARTDTGYAFARLGTKSRPTDGLGTMFGGSASRIATSTDGLQFPNVGDVRLLSSAFPSQGDTIRFSFKRQDRDSAQQVTISLDRDRNPWNSNARVVARRDFDATSSVETTRMNGATSRIPPNRYWVQIKITDANGQTRYDYLPRYVIVSAPSTASTPPPATPMGWGTLFSNHTIHAANVDSVITLTNFEAP